MLTRDVHQMADTRPRLLQHLSVGRVPGRHANCSGDIHIGRHFVCRLRFGMINESPPTWSHAVLTYLRKCVKFYDRSLSGGGGDRWEYTHRPGDQTVATRGLLKSAERPGWAQGAGKKTGPGDTLISPRQGGHRSGAKGIPWRGRHTVRKQTSCRACRVPGSSRTWEPHG